MDNGQNWIRIGQEIRSAVSDSVNQENIEQLGGVISGLADNIIKEARKQSRDARGSASSQAGQSAFHQSGTQSSAFNQAGSQNSAFSQAGTQQTSTYRTGGGQEQYTQTTTSGGREDRYTANWNRGTIRYTEDPSRSVHKTTKTTEELRSQYVKNRGAQAQGGNGTAASGNTQTQSKQLPAVKVDESLKVPGYVMAIGGGAGGVFSLFNVLAGLIGVSFFGKGMAFTVFSAALLVGCTGISIKGVRDLKLLNRGKKYAGLTGGRAYLEIEKIASRTGQDARAVLKDLKRMIRRGIYPQGHLDNAGTTLMLTDQMYEEYNELEQQRIRQDEKNMLHKAAGPVITVEAEELTPLSSAVEITPELEKNNPELAQMLREGNRYIRRLHALNDQIPGEVISEKLRRLEDLMKEIFERVADHPEQQKKMHKFMSYYLPTTLKLVEAYKEFDTVSSPGEDILQAKAEIEQTLDTINSSFRELLNQLYIDSVYDATADAKVLKTMLEKEGLGGSSPFNTK